jgi:hypothetical protein
MCAYIQNLAGHALSVRVTRKVNLADRSADYQCHSVFTQAETNEVIGELT